MRVRGKKKNTLTPLQSQLVESAVRKVAGENLRKKVPSSSNFVKKIVNAAVNAVFNPERGGYVDARGNIVPSPAALAGYMGPTLLAEVSSQLKSRSSARPSRPFKRRGDIDAPRQPRVVRFGDRWGRVDGYVPRFDRPDEREVELPRPNPVPRLRNLPPEVRERRLVHEIPRDVIPAGGVAGVPPAFPLVPVGGDVGDVPRIGYEPPALNGPDEVLHLRYEQPELGAPADVDRLEFDIPRVEHVPHVDGPPRVPFDNGIRIEEGEWMDDDNIERLGNYEDQYPADDEQVRINAEIARDAALHEGFDEDQAQLDAELDALEEVDLAQQALDRENELAAEEARENVEEDGEYADHDDPDWEDYMDGLPGGDLYQQALRNSRVPHSLDKIYLELNDAAPPPDPSFFDLSPDTIINPNKYARDYPIAGPVLIGEEKLKVNVKRRSDYGCIFGVTTSFYTIGDESQEQNSCYIQREYAASTFPGTGRSWLLPIIFISDIVYTGRPSDSVNTALILQVDDSIASVAHDYRYNDVDNRYSLTYLPEGTGVSQRLGRVVSGSYISLRVTFIPSIRVPQPIRSSPEIQYGDLFTLNPACSVALYNQDVNTFASTCNEYTIHRVLVVLSTHPNPQFADIVVDSRDIYSPVSLHMCGQMEVLKDVRYAGTDVSEDSINVQLKEREFFYDAGSSQLRGSHVYIIYAACCPGVPFWHLGERISSYLQYRPPKMRYSYTFGFDDA